MSNLNNLKERLLNNRDARANLLAALENFMEAQGVDISNPEVRTQLGLDADVDNAEDFMAGLHDYPIALLLNPPTIRTT